MPWRGKSVYLLAASPSPMGGIRGLWQTRIPLEGCGSLVFPDMFALPHAGEAFDEKGQLRDRTLRERLEKEIVGFLRLAEALIPACAGKGKAPAPTPVRTKEIAAALEDESQLQPES